MLGDHAGQLCIDLGLRDTATLVAIVTESRYD
jgi:hypothetical protein